MQRFPIKAVVAATLPRRAPFRTQKATVTVPVLAAIAPAGPQCAATVGKASGCRRLRAWRLWRRSGPYWSSPRARPLMARLFPGLHRVLQSEAPEPDAAPVAPQPLAARMVRSAAVRARRRRAPLIASTAPWVRPAPQRLARPSKSEPGPGGLGVVSTTLVSTNKSTTRTGSPLPPQPSGRSEESTAWLRCMPSAKPAMLDFRSPGSLAYEGGLHAASAQARRAPGPRRPIFVSTTETAPLQDRRTPAGRTGLPGVPANRAAAGRTTRRRAEISAVPPPDSGREENRPTAGLGPPRTETDRDAACLPRQICKPWHRPARVRRSAIEQGRHA
ncbi:hypothetical protein SAMN04488021_13441 [Paracoccus aminovorans]|uniref:Uncharacterized protein n=1 Tax=Paracoccus aminovorans TaxID=34004 RepID=A0A1I3CYL9_9RHOB|nr:hypothetical protein SAMN04488021_13441 [Paracoccus aminovorans]